MRSKTLIGLVITAFTLTMLAFPSPASAAPTCLGAIATIVGTSASETLQGGPDRDVIVGLGGNDTIYGADGDDLLCGSGGADLLFGQDGDDTLDGGNGNDELFGGSAIDGGDFLIGGAGNDRITAEHNLFSNASPDTLDYSQASAAIQVDVSSQTITGGAGTGTDFIVDFAEVYEVLGTPYDDVFDTKHAKPAESPR
jgi:Ca2+-binding RTX toxin-like protein